ICTKGRRGVRGASLCGKRNKYFVSQGILSRLLGSSFFPKQLPAGSGWKGAFLTAQLTSREVGCFGSE
ncbi:MAG: hypothetical protein IJ347_08740, partial [Faecalibacterium sp.]|nr:hypothetical protein [Faecalibacterium sp.]